MRINPVIRKTESPEPVYQRVLRLTDCKAERDLLARLMLEIRTMDRMETYWSANAGEAKLRGNRRESWEAKGYASATRMRTQDLVAMIVKHCDMGLHRQNELYLSIIWADEEDLTFTKTDCDA